jgi:hypothetical protein
MRLQGPTEVIKAVNIFQLINDLSLLHTSVGVRECCNFKFREDLTFLHFLVDRRMQLSAYTRPLPLTLHCRWKDATFGLHKTSPSHITGGRMQL